MTKPIPQSDNVTYCPKCGHSHFRQSLLARGDDNCGRTVMLLSLPDWKAIAATGSLDLTDAGRNILEDPND